MDPSSKQDDPMNAPAERAIRRKIDTLPEEHVRLILARVVSIFELHPHDAKGLARELLWHFDLVTHHDDGKSRIDTSRIPHAFFGG